MLRLARQQRITRTSCPLLLGSRPTSHMSRSTTASVRRHSGLAELQDLLKTHREPVFDLSSSRSNGKQKRPEEQRLGSQNRQLKGKNSSKRVGLAKPSKDVKLEKPGQKTRAKKQKVSFLVQPPVPNLPDDLPQKMKRFPLDLLNNVAQKLGAIVSPKLSPNKGIYKYTLDLKLPDDSKIEVEASGTIDKMPEIKRSAVHQMICRMHERGLLEVLSTKSDKVGGEEAKKEKHALKDIYDYCARHLILPTVKVERRRITNLWKCNIDLPEQGIHVQSVAKGYSTAEISAALKFKAAAEEYMVKSGAENLVVKDQTGLSVETADKFHEWLKMERRSYKFDVEAIHIKAGDLWQCIFKTSDFAADEQIQDGLVVHAKARTIAESAALLSGAIRICKAKPEFLDQFAEALRAGKGRIMRKLTPLDLELPVESIQLMTKALRESNALGRDDIDPAAVNEPVLEQRRSLRHHLSEEEKRILSQKLADKHQRYLESDDLAPMRKIKSELPMNQYKDQVYQLVQENVYSIIVGATGSGKTTQVPQIILEKNYANGTGAEANIICTQPRRIAATSVARRVADEMGPELKDHVGHHVRFDARLPRQGGSITYCTTGILLQQLQAEPDRIFDHVSHLVIDEVHERDRIIDFTLTILKKAVTDRLSRGLKVPKITLMSATLDTELFAQYFKNSQPNGEMTAAPILSVPGRTFPVAERHLDDILSDLRNGYSPQELQVLRADKFSDQYLDIEKRFAGSSLTDSQVEKEDAIIIDWKSKQTLKDNELGSNTAEDGVVPYGLIATTIAHVLRTTEDGAILVFFPGLDEMQRVEKLLMQGRVLGIDVRDTTKYKTYMLHSSIPDSQRTVFDPVPQGTRKIILSTNIGETSITIPDVQHVIDTGKVRETRYDHVKRISSLQSTWISKSNAKQRAGRAGRVQNGHYLALYTKERHRSMRAIGLPELLRSDLQTTCLSIKASIRGVDMRQFLAEAIEPPEPGSVDEAIKNLVNLGALTPDHEFTALGRLLSSLPVHPALGKMIILGLLFRCLDPILVIGAAVEERGLFVMAPDVKAQSLKNKRSFANGSESDHLAVYNAFSEVRRHYSPQDERMAKDVAFNQYLHFGAWKSIHGAAQQIMQIFVEAGLMPNDYADSTDDVRSSGLFGGPSLNENSRKTHIVKAILLAGMQPNVAIQNHPGAILWRTVDDPNTVLPRTSVLAERLSRRSSAEDGSKRGTPKMVTFTNLVKSLDGSSTYLRDTSTVGPMALALFSNDFRQQQWNVFHVNSWLPLFVKSNITSTVAIRALMDFRQRLDRMLAHAFNDLANVGQKSDNGMMRRGGIHGHQARKAVADGVVSILDASEGLDLDSIYDGRNVGGFGSREWLRDNRGRLGQQHNRMNWMERSRVNNARGGRLGARDTAWGSRR